MLPTASAACSRTDEALGDEAARKGFVVAAAVSAFVEQLKVFGSCLLLFISFRWIGAEQGFVQRCVEHKLTLDEFRIGRHGVCVAE